jgi:hypothetical protein
MSALKTSYYVEPCVYPYEHMVGRELFVHHNMQRGSANLTFQGISFQSLYDFDAWRIASSINDEFDTWGAQKSSNNSNSTPAAQIVQETMNSTLSAQ